MRQFGKIDMSRKAFLAARAMDGRGETSPRLVSHSCPSGCPPRDRVVFRSCALRTPRSSDGARGAARRGDTRPWPRCGPTGMGSCRSLPIPFDGYASMRSPHRVMQKHGTGCG